jgi:DNA-binding transcriptional MocR family regulator
VVGASWLRSRVLDASAERVVIYPGSQAIIFNALLTLTSPGDVVLTEALTFPGIKAAAAKLGVRLIGVAMDKEGILPDALKDAWSVHKPKAIYLVPTQHNPTAVTLGPARRNAIAEILQKSRAILIEDDVYGCRSDREVRPQNGRIWRQASPRASRPVCGLPICWRRTQRRSALCAAVCRRLRKCRRR